MFNRPLIYDPQELKNLYGSVGALTSFGTKLIIIQHIDTLPKYVIKLLMYVGVHDLYPAMDITILRGRENDRCLEEKLRELLDKNGKRKKKRKGQNY